MSYLNNNSKKLLITILIFFTKIFTGNAQNLDLAWAKRIGSSGNDIANSLVVDANGNTYTTGSFQGTVDFDPGPGTFNLTSSGLDDIFIVKLDALGNFIFALEMGGSNNDVANSIAVDMSGNIYSTGRFWGTADFDPGPGSFNLTSFGLNDVFISKLDPSGNFIWAKQMGGPNPDNLFDIGYSIAVDLNGNVFTTGAFSATADFDPGPGTYNLVCAGNVDLFVSKLDPNGNFVWAIGVGGTAGEGGYGLKLDPNGNVYITGLLGSESSGVDFDPGPGVAMLYGDGAFVYKLDGNGNFGWARALRESPLNNLSSGLGWSIDLDSNGNVYTTGNFTGTFDFDPGPGTYNLTTLTNVMDIYISKLNSAGDFLWAKQLSGTTTGAVNQGTSIVAGSNGNVFTTGSFLTTVDFDPGPGTYNLVTAGSSDIFISTLDSTGNFISAKQMGGTNFDKGSSIKIGVSGTIYVTGSFNQITDFDPCPGNYDLTSAGGYDIFITKFASPLVNITASATSICPGESITFTTNAINGGPAPFYQWQVNGSNTGTNSPVFTTSTLNNGDQVSVILTSNSTCIPPTIATSNVITVTVSAGVPSSVIISTSNSTICSGIPVTFTASATNGGSAPSYQWQVNGSNAGSNSPTYTTSSLANGDVVKVIMTSSLTCVTGSPATSNTIVMNVTTSLTPAISISTSSSTICAGNTVTFMANSTNAGTNPIYQWQVNGINTGTNSLVFTTNSLNNNDVVKCILISNYVCVTTATVSSNSISMTVNSPVIPSVSITASANNICTGTLVTFAATPVNGGINPSYQWKINGINVGLNSSTYSTTGILNGDVISCVLTNPNSCSSTTTANSNAIAMIVTATITPTLNIVSSVNNICPFTPVTFTAIPANAGTPPSFQWKLNGADVGTNSITYTNNNLFNGDKVSCIMNTVTSCSSSPLVFSDTIIMLIKPVPSIFFTPAAPAIFQGGSIQLNATITGGISSYLWTPSTGLSNPNILNPIANPSITTVYNLNAIAVNGCSVDKQLIVKVFTEIYIPNSFTPNGDGNNDIFRIPQGTSLILQYFIIYDRYGNEIFRTTDIGKGWDGTYKGKKSPAGAYTYIIKGENSRSEISLTGTVILIH